MPATLKEYASITKDVTINAVIDRFEIWDSTKYKRLFEEVSPKEFSDLANEVMSGIQ